MSYHMILNSCEIVKTLNRYNSANIDATDMKYISFESSQRDESNGIKIIVIWSLDTEIVSKMSKSLSNNRMVNNDAIDIILPPFDSSWLELSNEL